MDNKDSAYENTGWRVFEGVSELALTHNKTHTEEWQKRRKWTTGTSDIPD